MDPRGCALWSGGTDNEPLVESVKAAALIDGALVPDALRVIEGLTSDSRSLDRPTS